MNYILIHEKTLLCAKNYQKAEAELIDCLQTVKRERVYEKLGYTSLHVYAVQALGFSDDQAYQFTRVALKSMEIPELKEAIRQGTLSVSKARRIVSVITPDTTKEWIGKASTLPQRELEREVVKLHPKEAVRERIRPLSEELSELRCSIPRDVEEMIRRVKDLESQRTKKSADVVQALRVSLAAYLEKHDPVKKAERNLGKPTKFSASRQIPAQIRHEVVKRDDGQCSYQDGTGKRCENRRWIDLHHKVPLSHGGTHAVENLTVLCSTHHRIHHKEELHQRVRQVR